MSFLRDAFIFLKRERVWTLLSIFLILVYAAVSSRTPAPTEKRGQAAVEKLRVAEAKLKENIQTTGGVKAFLSSNPRARQALGIFTGLLSLILLLGVGINIGWALRPQWRNRILSGAGPPEARTWGAGAVFKVILLFILGTMSLSFFLAVLKALFFRFASPNSFILLHTTLSDLLCIAFVVGIVTRLGGNWRDLGFRAVRFGKDFLIGLAGYAAILPYFFLILFFLVAVIQIFSYEPPPHPLVEVFLEEERSPALIAYSLFLACVVGPILEEIFFRGFCYPAFKKRWGMGGALMLSAAFFSAIHQNLFAFLPVFVLGLGLGYLYEKRGTLVPSITLHIVHNSVFIAYFFLAKDVLMRSG